MGFFDRLRRNAPAVNTLDDPSATPHGTGFTELGDTGLKRSGGMILEEFLPRLRGERGIAVYNEMGTDPVVKAGLLTIELMSRQVSWSVDAANASEQARKQADFIDSCFGDMQETFLDVISEALTMVQFGFDLQEIVLKRRQGLQPANKKNRSKFSDGLIGIGKLAPRSQASVVDNWILAPNGEVLGVTQFVEYGSAYSTTIPAWKMLHFRTSAKKGNPEGESVLRAAYKPWYYKTHMEEIEGIGAERDLAGLPVSEVPMEWLSSDANPNVKAVVNYLKTIGRNIRRDEQEYLLLPQAWDANGNKQVTFSLMSSGGSRQFDTDKIITRKNTEIALAMVTDFILLGHDKVGSFALSSSKTHTFGMAMGAWLDSIEDVFNRKLIPKLIELNGWPLDSLPVLKHSDVETPDLGVLGTFVQALSAAGVQLFPNESLEQWLVKLTGAPDAAVNMVGNLFTPEQPDAAEENPANPSVTEPAETPAQTGETAPEETPAETGETE